MRVNQENVLMFWEVGKYISSVLLGGERAGYGKQIVVTLAQQLQSKYGTSFDYSNVTRMIKFAARLPEIEIVVPLAQQLSWSHFIALLPLKNIAVAEYWTQLPPKKELERKLGEILEEARERLERRKLLTGSVKRDIEYFYEQKEDNDE